MVVEREGELLERIMTEERVDGEQETLREKI